MDPLLERLRGRLIVSCQARPDEPLFGSEMMARMALAARDGGAAGIRANTPADIAAIRAAVPDLPLIGLWKVDLPGFGDVYITPRVGDAKAVADAGADIIALDATLRPHPDGSAADLIRAVKAQTGKLVLADIATEADARAAVEAGADAISTTLSGYTADSPQIPGPDIELVARLAAANLSVPLIAEGRIATPEQLRAAFDAGAFAVVIGGAITRPQAITARFAAMVPSASNGVPHKEDGASVISEALLCSEASVISEAAIASIGRLKRPAVASPRRLKPPGCWPRPGCIP